MDAKLIGSLRTFFKYMVWTAAAAGLVYATDNLTALQLPEWAVPIIGAILKAIATFVATQKEE